MLSGLLALARVTAWLGLLYLVAHPWTSLGGLVDERLRWWEWFTVWTLPAVGFTLAGLVRDARLLFWPPLLLAGVAVPVLGWLGERELLGIVVTGWLGYTAGADTAWNVAPLLRKPPREDDPGDEGATPWLPPWERP